MRLSGMGLSEFMEHDFGKWSSKAMLIVIVSGEANMVSIRKQSPVGIEDTAIDGQGISGPWVSDGLDDAGYQLGLPFWVVAMIQVA